ncbi:MAG TPA: hypothetical protein VLK65_23750 [Vicinamibacteria bacterium]|nr:hypothetical protein [Vicinamibacteria bacterium]
MESIKKEPAEAPLPPRERALVDFAIELTRAPERAQREDLEVLRAHGLTDEDLFVLVHIIGYFNHINRVADALGVDLETDMPPAG